MNNIPNVVSNALSSIISDAVTIIAPGLPTASLCTAIQMTTHHLLNRRTEEAFEILLEETRDGVFPSRTPDDISSVLGMMLRYQRAAIEGSAKINLRIMASIFKGVLEKDTIYPDKFQSMANRISDLTIEEIQTISLIYKYRRAVEKLKADSPTPLGFENFEKIASDVFGNMYDDARKMLAYCSSASRTGLVMQQNDQNLFPYTTTHIMDDLVQLSDFQRILSDEI